MEKRIVFHVDFDYFYAQCEEIRNSKIKGKCVAVCIFSGIHIVYNYDKWPLNNDQSYVFPYLEKGSNYLIKEFPNEKKYQDSKEKIEEL